MTNFEKWKDEIATIRSGGHCVAVVNGEPVKCISFCNSCDFKGCPCVGKLIDWFLAEYQKPEPKLTKREREFLDSIFKEEGYKVSRGCFVLYMVFGEENVVCARLNQDMFTFIKRGESWTFEDLLKLEVEE